MDGQRYVLVLLISVLCSSRNAIAIKDRQFCLILCDVDARMCNKINPTTAEQYICLKTAVVCKHRCSPEGNGMNSKEEHGMNEKGIGDF